MYSEQFMAYLASYQNDEKENKNETAKKEHKPGIFSFLVHLFDFVKN